MVLTDTERISEYIPQCHKQFFSPEELGQSPEHCKLYKKSVKCQIKILN